MLRSSARIVLLLLALVARADTLTWTAVEWHAGAGSPQVVAGHQDVSPFTLVDNNPATGAVLFQHTPYNGYTEIVWGSVICGDSGSYTFGADCGMIHYGSGENITVQHYDAFGVLLETVAGNWPSEFSTLTCAAGDSLVLQLQMDTTDGSWASCNSVSLITPGAASTQPQSAHRHLVSVVISGTGSVTPSLRTWVADGESQGFDYTAGDGQVLVSLDDNGAAQQIGGQVQGNYLLAAVTADHTLTFTFAPSNQSHGDGGTGGTGSDSSVPHDPSTGQTDPVASNPWSVTDTHALPAYPTVPSVAWVFDIDLSSTYIAQTWFQGSWHWHLAVGDYYSDTFRLAVRACLAYLLWMGFVAFCLKMLSKFGYL